jgi:hypothetical protein
MKNAQKDESAHGYLARKVEASKKLSRFAHINQRELRKMKALAIPRHFQELEFIKDY